MGKTARRSIDIDELPSSPSSSPYLYKNNNKEQSSVTHQQFWSHYDFQVVTPSVSKPEAALSQIKNVESKTSKTSIPPLSSSTKSSKTSQKGIAATQKPSTTTYRAFTTTYRSTASTRNYIYSNRSDKLTELDRLRMREEFFATYDVMTGIRIAATLGGFFILMVFLIVYKSRSSSEKALDDPKIVAQAAATVQEEEDREFQEAYEKTAYSLYQDELDLPMPLDFDLNRDRITSLGNVSFSSCPPYLINANLRFSSIGGYSTLLEPPRRSSDMPKNRRQSSLESSSSRMLSAYHLNDHYSNQNENFFNESDGEEAGDEFDQRFTTTAEIASYPHSLPVPRAPDSRRSSGMTCCSTESSYLERRCSAITLGLSSLAPMSRASSRRAIREAWDHDLQQQYQYPGIHIIEATPKSSPCPSERQSHLSCNREMVGKEHIKVLDRFKRRRNEDNSIDSISEYPDEATASNNGHFSENIVIANGSQLQQNCNSKILASSNHENEETSHKSNNNNNNIEGERRAPLASLSSFKMSSAECADSTEDGHNASVFDDELSCADTDDDMEQFSTDSDEISLQSPPSIDQHVPSGGSTIKCDNSSVINVKSEITLKEPTKASEDIERQQRSNDKTTTITPTTIRPVNYSLTSDKKIKSNSSECVAILDYNNERNFSMKPSTSSSAVILEMPVLFKQEIEQAKAASSHHLQDSSETHRLLDLNIDPSFGDGDHKSGGSSSNRKWSKETLF